MPGLYRDQGVVLRTIKLGEADRIVTIFTQGHGKHNWTSRVRVLSANGPLWLSLPVRRSGKGLQLVSELQTDGNEAHWMPKMLKTRMMLARSVDRGQRWKLVSNVTVDPKVGTEGLGEPVLARISKGPNPGRLI